MRKSNILMMLIAIISMLIMNCEVNSVQPPLETAPEIYICEIVYVPVHDHDIDVQHMDDVSEPNTIYSIEPQDINGDFDILTPCGYSYEQLLYSVSDEYRMEMTKYVDTFLEAEETYGVNAFYLMCKMGLESGWARYPSGENNLGGWTNADGTYMDFESEEKCILYIAEKLSTEYRDISGTRLEDVCQRYCPYDGYSETLIDIMISQREKIKEMEV